MCLLACCWFVCSGACTVQCQVLVAGAFACLLACLLYIIVCWRNCIFYGTKCMIQRVFFHLLGGQGFIFVFTLCCFVRIYKLEVPQGVSIMVH